MNRQTCTEQWKHRTAVSIVCPFRLSMDLCITNKWSLPLCLEERMLQESSVRASPTWSLHPLPVLHNPRMLCPCRGKLKLLVVSLSFVILFTWLYLLVGNSESEYQDAYRQISGKKQSLWNRHWPIFLCSDLKAKSFPFKLRWLGFWDCLS